MALFVRDMDNNLINVSDCHLVKKSNDDLEDYAYSVVAVQPGGGDYRLHQGTEAECDQYLTEFAITLDFHRSIMRPIKTSSTPRGVGET